MNKEAVQELIILWWEAKFSKRKEGISVLFLSLAALNQLLGSTEASAGC